MHKLVPVSVVKITMARAKINHIGARTKCCLIGLICIWLIGSVTSSPSKGAPVKNENPIRIEELMDELNKELPKRQSSVWHVMDVLSRVDEADRKKQNVILGKFNVNLLLDLLQIDDKMYTYEEFQRRSEICNQLKRSKNLRKFCKGSMESFMEGYMEKIEKEYSSLVRFMSPSAKTRIRSFGEQVSRFLVNYDNFKPKDAIRMVLDTMASSDKKKLESSCRKLLEKLAQSKRNPHSDSDEINGEEEGWLMRQKCCKQVLLSS